jgi:hypothetical protein
VADAFEIRFAFSTYAKEPTPRDITVTFQHIADNGETQKLTPREVEREGYRFFIVTLPDGAVRRFRLKGPIHLEPVDSIPGGDP